MTASPERSWQVLTDVDRLAGWVGIVHEVVELSRLERYTAALADQVGPFKLRADLEIAANVLRDGYEIELDASGRDRAVDSRIAVHAVLRLDAAEPGGTTILTEGRYEVTGRVAAMGSSIIEKKAERVLEEFFANAGRELGTA
ncbi:CoxG family protein [Dactylosporangium sp. CA-092794]|uniref:CoxG family protein n=1 Tax=Dactylosporangium sp. CA-092794 TaxID=3239929 RepID=UPI003D93D1E4